MGLDVKVKIDLSKPIGNAGFGYPLIIAKGSAAKEYTDCTTLEDVKTAGYEETTDTYKAAARIWEQKNKPSKIAVCTVENFTKLSEIQPKGWRQAYVAGFDYESSENASDVTALLTFFNTTDDKLLFPTVKTTDGLSKFNDSDRVFAVVHTTDLLASAAVIGATAGYNAGEITYKNMIIKGVTPDVLTDTQLEEISTANGCAIVEKAGDIVTSEGKVMSGEFADIIDSMDYIVTNISYKCQKLMNTSPKVSYDNKGIALLESCVIDVLRTAYNNGMIAENEDGTPDYSTYFAPRSEVSAADRTARTYKGGTAKLGLAGAIHYADIEIEITV